MVLSEGFLELKRQEAQKRGPKPQPLTNRLPTGGEALVVLPDSIIDGFNT